MFFCHLNFKWGIVMVWMYKIWVAGLPILMAEKCSQYNHSHSCIKFLIRTGTMMTEGSLLPWECGIAIKQHGSRILLWFTEMFIGYFTSSFYDNSVAAINIFPQKTFQLSVHSKCSIASNVCLLNYWQNQIHLVLGV